MNAQSSTHNDWQPPANQEAWNALGTTKTVSQLQPRTNDRNADRSELKLCDVLEIEHRTIDSQKFCSMFKRKEKLLFCCLCHVEIGTIYTVLEHMFGKKHLKTTNKNVIELSHPSYFAVQPINGNAYEAFEQLQKYLTNQQLYNEDEFIEAMNLPIDQLVEIEFFNASGEWESLLNLHGSQYVCNLCKGLRFPNESAVRNHVQSATHIENGKIVLKNYENSIHSRKDTIILTDSISKQKGHTKFIEKAENKNSTQKVNAVENDEMNSGKLTREQNRASQIVNGILKLIADHERKCNNPRCDLDCALSDIKANLMDDDFISDTTIHRRTENISDSLEMKKNNQIKLQNSIEVFNARLHAANNIFDKGFSEFIIVPGSDFLSIFKPKNSCRVPISSLKNTENVSPFTEENELRVLRHISALEYLLGSLGPLSSELMKKTLKFHTKGHCAVFTMEDILLLETIREKLLGLIEIDIHSAKEIQAVKKVLHETKTFIDYHRSYKMQQAGPDKDFIRFYTQYY